MSEVKRFIDCYIDTETCNFRCHYCYITQLGKFRNKLFKLTHSPSEIAEALSKKRLGGVCLINLCAGGETLLSKDVIPLTKALLDEGHYVMVVTNGSLTQRFKEIRDTFTESERQRLFFKFSFHYLELKRLNIIEQYFENVQMMRDAGCSFTCELVPSDETIPYIDEIKDVCIKYLGALCHVTVARNDKTKGIDLLSEKNIDIYKQIWSTFDSALFDFKINILGKKRKEFCYAGDWSLYVNLTTGDYSPCNCGPIKGNIYTDKFIKFKAIGRCQLPYCFNGHAWLIFGTIPRFSKITYMNERDRVDLKNGRHWITSSFDAPFNYKLEEKNAEYNLFHKTVCKIGILINNGKLIVKRLLKI